MKCGDVVLVSYPFIHAGGAKVRPAVIISADKFNAGGDRIVVPITTH